MLGMRTLIRNRWLGGLLVFCPVILLATYALVASLGTGMSAASAFAMFAGDICSVKASDAATAPTRDDDRGRTGHQSQCPLCFIAAQAAGLPAMVPGSGALPAFQTGQIAVLDYAEGYRGQVRRLPRRTTGAPRGPPSYSV